MKSKLQFTVIFVRDHRSGLFTAYLPDFPSAVADGESEEDALKNLKEAMQLLNEARHEFDATQQPSHSDQVTTGSIELEFA